MVARRTRTVLAVLVVLVVLAAGLTAVAWRLTDPGGSAAPLALEPAPASSAASRSAPSDRLRTASSWVVAPPSVVGYRIRERYVGRTRDEEVVARTGEVTGLVETDAPLRVRRVRVDVRTGTLSSGSAQRDDVLRTRGLETDRYPVATFESDEVDVPADAVGGRTVTVRVPGRLTLHGVTRRVATPVSFRATATGLEVLVRHDIRLEDYGIQPPSVAGLVTVEPRGTIEGRLVLEPRSR